MARPDDNHARLAARFAEQLLERRPSSVLDLGCGAGDLLQACRAANVPCLGIDVQISRLASCARAGLPVLRAAADRVPLTPGSFEWVALRHVAHHLPALDEALAEAWRVARTGLLIAEPWYDPAVPSQRFGLRADRWLKRQDRRAGRFHADCLEAAALVNALPERTARVAVETHTELLPWSEADLATEAHDALTGLPPEDEDARELSVLLELAQGGRLTRNGTLILAVQK